MSGFWRFALLLAGCLVFAAVAETPQRDPEPSASAAATTAGEGTFWRDSADLLEDWWRQSRQSVGAVWQGTQEYLSLSEQDRFGQIWDEALPALDEALELQERQADLPQRAWFADDQISNQQAIDRLLDQVVAILARSPSQDYRARIRLLQREIAAARRDIAEFRQRRVSAPERSALQRTREDYLRLIDERQSEVRGMERMLQQTREQFADELRASGLQLTDAQVEFLLSTVVGDNLLDLGAVFDNVKAIGAQLEQLLDKSGEDLASARRYYGLHVILLHSLERMHRQVEQAIVGQYLPRIDAIAEQAANLNRESRRLLEHSPDKKSLLQANMEAQRLTIETADLYRDYLKKQRREVAQARRELDRDIDAAWNTYNTVRVSGELLGLVRASRQLLQGLRDRQVPPLRPFGNLALQREFEKLTLQLRAVQQTRSD